MTAVFHVYAAVQGNTIRNADRKLRASFIGPTIDAGVIPVESGGGAVTPVTG